MSHNDEKVDIVLNENTEFITKAIKNLQEFLGESKNITRVLLGDYWEIMKEIYESINVSNRPEEAFNKIYKLYSKDREKFLIVMTPMFGISKEIIRRLSRSLHIQEIQILKILIKGEEYSSSHERKILTEVLKQIPYIENVIGWKHIKSMFSVPINNPLWNILLILATKGSISAKLGNVLNDYLIKLIINKCRIPKNQLDKEKKSIEIYQKVIQAPRRIDIIIKDNRGIPRILCMISYQMTTSSLQTAKGIAEEKFQKLKDEITAFCGQTPLFIGFVDGIGWIARGKRDIYRLVEIYDYVFTFSRNSIQKFLNLIQKSIL